MSNPNPPAPAPRWFVWLGLVALLGYAIFVGTWFSPYAGGSDSSGYLNEARLFASGHLRETLRVPAGFPVTTFDEKLYYVPLGFWPTEGNTSLKPTYPNGLPLHFALAAKVLGWQAGATAVGILGAAGAALLMYAAARELGVSWQLAAAGGAVLALCPVFIFAAVQPLSDLLATTWCLATIWAALRARQHTAWAAAAGAGLAIAVLVRPTNLLLAPAVLVALGLDWRRLLLCGAAGLPGAVWLAYFNHTLYGSAFTSGYGDIFSAFEAKWGWPTAVHFAKWLALLLPTVLLMLPLAALLRPATRGRGLVVLGVWFGAIAGTYIFYVISHEQWWDLRFILPAIPALILGGLLGLEALTQRPLRGSPGTLRAAFALILLLWAGAISWYWTKSFNILLTKGYERAYAEGSQLARAKVPANGLVVCCYFSGSLFFYSDLAIVRWDSMQPAVFEKLAGLARASQRPVYALIFEAEENDLRERCGGHWTKIDHVANVGLWQLDAPAAGAARP